MTLIQYLYILECVSYFINQPVNTLYLENSDLVLIQSMKILLELPISVNTAGLYYRDKTPLLRTPYTLHSRS